MNNRHKAILDYLNASGFSESYAMLQNETHISDFVPDPKQKYAGLLEKKWTSVIRLQKKVRTQAAGGDKISNYSILGRE